LRAAGRATVISWLLLGPALTLTGLLFAWPLAEAARAAAAGGGFNLAGMWTPAYRGDLLFTAGTALAATALALAAGFLLAVRLHGSRGLVAALIAGLALAPLLVPHLVAAYAVRLLLAPSGLLERGLLAGHGPDLVLAPVALVAALSWKFLPFAYLNARAARSAVPPELLEVAADCGAGAARRSTAVLMPLMAPGLAAGAVLVFVLAAAQFSITLVAYGGTQVTAVPMDVYFLAEGENLLGPAAALGLVYGALVVLASLAGDSLVRWRVRATAV
jgi:putative spermidine/putrescine transport system permease protein